MPRQDADPTSNQGPSNAVAAIRHFRGMTPSIDPHDAQSGDSLHQVNVISGPPGELRVRLGCRQVLFGGESRATAAPTPSPSPPTPRSYAQSANDSVSFFDSGPFASPAVSMQIGSSTTLPDPGNSPSLGDWRWSSVPGTWWGEFWRPVDQDAVSPYQSAFLGLAGTRTLGTSWYSGSLQDTNNRPSNASLYGMPYNQIRGDTPTVPLTVWEYPQVGYDPPSIPYSPAQSQENWPFSFQHCGVTNNSPVVTGSGFSGKMRAGGYAAIGLTSPSATYLVASVDSDTQFTLASPYPGQTNADIQVFGPYGVPPDSPAFASDAHWLALQRDEATGLPSKLWEVYQLYSTDGGQSTRAASAATWDLRTGSQRIDGAGSPTAAGIPLLPFVVTYPEAASGLIDHALRITVSNGYKVGGQVWPALAATGNPDATLARYALGQLPLGARLRLSRSWYDANVGSFSTLNQAILTALMRYGAINGDWTGNSGYGIALEGAQDGRWVYNDVAQLRTIPLSAFELIDTVRPQLTLTGPSSLSVGVPATFILTYRFAGVNQSYNYNYYFYYTRTGDPEKNFGMAVVKNGTGPSYSASFTPTLPGTYSIRVGSGASLWLVPPAIAYVV